MTNDNVNREKFGQYGLTRAIFKMSAVENGEVLKKHISVGKYHIYIKISIWFMWILIFVNVIDGSVGIM